MLVRQTTRLFDDKDAPKNSFLMFALNVEIQTFLLFLKIFSNEEFFKKILEILKKIIKQNMYNFLIFKIFKKMFMKFNHQDVQQDQSINKIIVIKCNKNYNCQLVMGLGF
jgi:trans-2-enoyl-CoA reductase